MCPLDADDEEKVEKEVENAVGEARPDVLHYAMNAARAQNAPIALHHRRLTVARL